jgi:ubiquinone/menaquinone biosynthesis C-methylase UbiE
MTDEEVAEIYAKTQQYELKPETDLNSRSIERIRAVTAGKSVLDIGCGTGGISATLESSSYLGVDFVSSPHWNDLTSDFVKFKVAPAGETGLPDGHAQVVLCCHVLEHVRDVAEVLFELKRLTTEKVVIALPRERPYRAGFNLHVNFYSYVWQVEAELSKAFENVNVEIVDGDFLVVIDA